MGLDQENDPDEETRSMKGAEGRDYAKPSEQTLKLRQQLAAKHENEPISAEDVAKTAIGMGMHDKFEAVKGQKVFQEGGPQVGRFRGGVKQEFERQRIEAIKKATLGSGPPVA